MSKYIDAEKLIAEIKRRKVILDKYKDSFETAACCKQELEWMEDFISSLQQEQSDSEEEKSWSLQIQAYLTTASDELYAPEKPLYTKEHYEGIHECMKMWQKLHQYYFSTKQEQPEVELENYISNKLRELGANLINHKPYSFNRGLNVGETNAYQDILDRLNAKKEE